MMTHVGVCVTIIHPHEADLIYLNLCRVQQMYGISWDEIKLSTR